MYITPFKDARNPVSGANVRNKLEEWTNSCRQGQFLTELSGSDEVVVDIHKTLDAINPPPKLMPFFVASLKFQ